MREINVKFDVSGGKKWDWRPDESDLLPNLFYEFPKLKKSVHNMKLSKKAYRYSAIRFGVYQTHICWWTRPVYGLCCKLGQFCSKWITAIAIVVNKYNFGDLLLYKLALKFTIRTWLYSSARLSQSRSIWQEIKKQFKSIGFFPVRTRTLSISLQFRGCLPYAFT